MIPAGSDRKLKVGTSLKDWMRGEKLPEWLTVTTDGSSTTTSATVNIGSPTNGQVVLIVFRNCAAASITFPGGWTQLENSTIDASADTYGIAYRICDGTEGATITVTQGAAVRYVAIAWVMDKTIAPVYPGLTRFASNTSPVTDPMYAGITHGVINLFLAISTNEAPDDYTADPDEPWKFGGTFQNTGSSGAGIATIRWSYQYARANRVEAASGWSMTASHAWMTCGIVIRPDPS